MQTRIELKDIRPNPFRSPGLPFDPIRLEQLKANIKSTDFWKNVNVRPHPKEKGKYELIYGHHRLEALRQLGVTEEDFEVNVKTDDAIMLKIMAQENMEEWKQSPSVTHETIKMVYNYMKSNGLLDRTESIRDLHEIIAEFIKWPSGRVEHALADLRAMGEVELEGHGKAKEVVPIKKEILESLPTIKHTKAFREAVKKTRASTKVQRMVARQFKDEAAHPHVAEQLIKDAQKRTGELPSKEKEVPEIDRYAEEVVHAIVKLDTQAGRLKKSMRFLNDYRRKQVVKWMKQVIALFEELIKEAEDETKKISPKEAEMLVKEIH